MSGATSPAPFRIAFDNARDPYTARNALGITPTEYTSVTTDTAAPNNPKDGDLWFDTASGQLYVWVDDGVSPAWVPAGSGGGGGAPTDAEYITATPDPTLTNERALTNTASITWDLSTPGQAKANTASGGGNVSNSGTPTSGQYARWVTATTIAGVAPAMVLSDIGGAPLASPTFTGDPKAPTPTAGDNDTSIATTAFVTAADNAVKTQLIGSASSGFDTLGEIENYIAANITPTLANKADIFSPTLTGDPKAPTPATADNDTSIATTAYVKANLANYQPLDGDLTAIAALAGTNVIYYRSAANTWTAVTIGGGLSFTGGTLAASGGGGDVFLAGNNTFTGQNCFTVKGVVIGHTAALTVDRSLELHGSSGSVVDGVIQQVNWANGAACETHYFDKSRGTTVGSHAAVQSGDSLGEINFRGSTGSVFNAAAAIRATVNGTPSGSVVPGAVGIHTTNAAGTSVLAVGISPAACNLIGQTNAGDSAPTGYVGEYLTASGVSTALTNGAYTQCATLSIPAGDWDVRGVVRVTGTAGTYMYVSVFTLTASGSGNPDSLQTGILTGLGDVWTAVGPFRVNISAATTYYLNVYAGGAGMTCTISQIQLRRRH
jgi:hypothetical protein